MALGRCRDRAVQEARASVRQARPKDDTMSIATVKFSAILWGLAQSLKLAARRHPAFRARLREKNLVAQIKARDEETGRWYALRDGKVTSRAGLHAKPDITLAFKTAAHGVSLLTPPINWL